MSVLLLSRIVLILLNVALCLGIVRTLQEHFRRKSTWPTGTTARMLGLLAYSAISVFATFSRYRTGEPFTWRIPAGYVAVFISLYGIHKFRSYQRRTA